MIFAELSRPIPRTLSWRHAKLISVCDFQESTARRGGDWMRKLPDSTPFLRFFALELFNWARGCVLHGRYVDQTLP
jgi:hypothetical protein